MKRSHFLLFMTLCLCGGCMQRTLTVNSNPPGAMVYLNGLEIGRTPVTRDMLWYGTYDVELRKEGYDSIKTTAQVWAPWWQWVPFDLFTDMLPIADRHVLRYTLHPPTEQQTEADLLIRRGEQLQRELESTERPTTQPATRPGGKRKSTERATKPSR